MGVCDLLRCGPITSVQSGCVWLGPQQVLYNMAPMVLGMVMGISDLVIRVSMDYQVA